MDEIPFDFDIARPVFPIPHGTHCEDCENENFCNIRTYNGLFVLTKEALAPFAPGHYRYTTIPPCSQAFNMTVTMVIFGWGNISKLRQWISEETKYRCKKHNNNFNKYPYGIRAIGMCCKCVDESEMEYIAKGTEFDWIEKVAVERTNERQIEPKPTEPSQNDSVSWWKKHLFCGGILEPFGYENNVCTKCHKLTDNTETVFGIFIIGSTILTSVSTILFLIYKYWVTTP